MNTPIGKIGIVADEQAIHRIIQAGLDSDVEIAEGENSITCEACRQLNEYFEGRRKEFSLPLQLKGTEFTLNVWNELRNIPYGEVRSYKEVAEAVGSPKAMRAVGNANNKNPIPIIIPCHRVIGANGKLVGFDWGLDIKERLLSLESKK